MTPQDRPILEYRTPAAAALVAGTDDGGGDRVFTFSPPPVIFDLIVQGAVVVLFASSALALIATGAWHLWHNWSWNALFLVALCVVICLMVASSNWRHLRNGMRFGGLPVKLTITGEHLIMTQPVQWGLKQHAVPLQQIRRCYVEFGGWSPAAMTIYRINVDVRGRGTIELRIASSAAAATAEEAVAVISSRLPSTTAAK